MADVFYQLMRQIAAYLPNLLGALLLVMVGLGAGWLAKRVIIQVASILKLGRQFRRFRWGRDLAKADVRQSVYGLLGNLGFLIVFLIFLQAAFTVMNLGALSKLSEELVFLFPHLLTAGAIFGAGWLVSRWAAAAIRQALRRERVPRHNLIAGYSRVMIILFSAGMAVRALEIAHDIVVIGFSVIFVTLGAVAIILASHASRGIVARLISQKQDESGEGEV